jgi:hypothetical protein
MQTTDNNITPLRIAARPGSALDEFNVYYLAFKNKMGVVKVKLSSAEMKSPSNQLKAIAEMKALEYLLAGLEILSEGRTGAGVVITATSRSIKEVMLINALAKPIRDSLLQEARTLKYIKGTNLPRATYYAMAGLMPSVIARFIKANIIISDDVKWISPVVPEKNVHQLAGNRRVMQRVDINSIGKVAITSHAFNRFTQRSKINSPEVLWEYFLKALREPTIKLTPSNDEELDRYHEELHGQIGRRYYDTANHWHFIIVEDGGELVLVTCFHYEVTK